MPSFRLWMQSRRGHGRKDLTTSTHVALLDVWKTGQGCMPKHSSKPPDSWLHLREIQLINTLHSHLQPGGYIELQEYSTEVCSPDPNISPRGSGSTIAHWADLFNEASSLSGRPPGSVVTRNIKRELLAAGFVDVRQEVLMLPLGMWHPRREMKELGGYALLNMLDGVEGFTLRLFTKFLGWTEEQCQNLIEDVRKEFKKGVRFYTAQ